MYAIGAPKLSPLSLSFIRNLAIYLHLEHVILVFFKIYFDVSMCVASYLVVVASPCLLASLVTTYPKTREVSHYLIIQLT
jgi:hypothetical protein